MTQEYENTIKYVKDCMANNNMTPETAENTRKMIDELSKDEQEKMANFMLTAIMERVEQLEPGDRAFVSKQIIEKMEKRYPKETAEIKKDMVDQIKKGLLDQIKSKIIEQKNSVTNYVISQEENLN